MANDDESNPLLPPKQQEETTKNNDEKSTKNVDESFPVMGWTAQGLPVNDQMMLNRSEWDSGILSCLGRHDDFCSSDLEVCLLGSVAPCVLYGTNVERLGSAPGTFTNHCLPYTGLYLLGNSLFGWNCLAPWFSYPIRTAIRRKFNLEGTCEALSRSCGCCGSLVEDEVQREQCETTCDFATHVFCHACAMCQEGREIRRRLQHPGFNAQRPVLVMIPPGGQAMGREA